MEHIKKAPSSTEYNSLYEDYGLEGRSNIPDCWKSAREVTIQAPRLEEDLFSNEDIKKSFVIRTSRVDEEGKAIANIITSVDFKVFIMAVSQILFNQSWQSGNADTNSGIEKTSEPDSSTRLNDTAYLGAIDTSIEQLCRLGYGVDKPDTRQRKAMETIIEELHKNKLRIKYPNGDEAEEHICIYMGRKRKKGCAGFQYKLYLNPIFTRGIKNQFALHPQDAMKRLTAVVKKKTPAHITLLQILGIQDKRKPCERTKEKLLEELDMVEEYKAQRKRTEAKLEQIFKDLIKQGILKGYKIEKVPYKDRDTISKYIFYLNQDYASIKSIEESSSKDD